MDFIPVGDEDRREMLSAIGAATFDDLLSDIPPEVRLRGKLRLPPPLSELEARRYLEAIAARNAPVNQWLSFLGGGAYDHFVPAVVDEISSRAEFYTAYTPYQPEVSQGTLQTIYEYQSLIARLTGMEISNASLYDGGTAIAEAVLMANAANRRTEVVASGCINPMRLAVLDTYLEASGITVHRTGWKSGATELDEVTALVTDKTGCVLVENPNFFGVVEQCRKLAAVAHQKGALFIVSVDPVSLGVLAPPSEYGADIVVGEGQPLGNYLSFGGPYLGFMATHKEHIRRLPGRIVGKTVDTKGRPCYCLTLQTREQHIRREKATSNICSNQALVALRAAVHLCWLGKDGMRELATQCLSKAVYAQRALAKRGLQLRFRQPCFKEFAVSLPVDAEVVVSRLFGERILAGVPLGRFYPEASHLLLIAVTEKRTREEIDRLADCLADVVRGEVA
ncbi:MAG TPA: aminomethyl-transferring glycine dehydrogenase subunit GcvPA [bacterium]|nr:aminomethyl-transferring glycine dehydrogenase subunit GcvPA [bacterium]